METTETTLDNTEIPETDMQQPEASEPIPEIPETPGDTDETETDGQTPEMPEPDTPKPENPGQDISGGLPPDAPAPPELENPPDKTPDISIIPDIPVNPEPEQEEEKETNTEIPLPDFSGYLGELTESIEKTQRMDEVLERLDTLALMLAPEEEMEENSIERSSVILPGYEGFFYPVRVTYGITTATGYSTYVGFTYDSPEAFKSGFEKMETDVIDGNLQSFYIRYVYSGEGADAELLYDSESPVETPEPEPEPTPGTSPDNETIQQILTQLESAGTVLSDISTAGKQEYLLMADYREEMLMLQSADTGASVILCIVMIAMLAEITFAEFFRRFK